MEKLTLKNAYKDTRKTYYDFLKFCAIFIIVLTHFIDCFAPSLFRFWDQFPTSILLFGVSGKLGVAIFGVVMCVLASESNENNPLVYFLKRYLYFVICGILINTLYVIYGYSSLRVDIIEFLKLSFLLSDKLFPTFWCIPDFLIASCLAYLNGKYQVKIKGILFEMVILILCRQFWVAICLMGCLVKSIMKAEKCKRLFSHHSAKVLGCVLIFFAIKRDEGILTYFIDGFCVALFLIIINFSERTKRVLSAPVLLVWIGRFTMSIFLIHSFVFMMVKEKLPLSVYGEGQLTALFVICIMVIGVSAYLLQFVLEHIKMLTDRLVEFMLRN